MVDLDLEQARVGAGGEVVLVRVVGEVDVYTFPVLRDYLRNEVLAVEDLPRYAGLELSGVAFWDSCGIGVLVQFLHKFRVRRPDGGVLVVAPSETVRKILLMTGLSRVFPIVESEEEMLGLIGEWEAGGGLVGELRA